MTVTHPDSSPSLPLPAPAAPLAVPPTAIASARHTILILLILLGNSALGAFIHHPIFPKVHLSRPVGYLVDCTFEWLLLGYVLYGIRNSGFRMKDLLRRTAPGEIHLQNNRRSSSLFRDFWIAVTFLFAQGLLLLPLGALLHRPPPSPNDPSNPNGGVETICYLLLCLSAGICEETIFRGYLQRQFAAFSGSTWRGLILQSIAFGASHGYQGIKLMILIAAGGCLFSLLARWRKSLHPGIIAHFLEDAVAGVLAPRLLR